jgi:TonB family protein
LPAAKAARVQAPRELVAQDLDTEDLEREIAQPVKLAPQKYAANDSEEDFKKVDRENAAKLAQLKSQMRQQTDEASAEQQRQLKAISQQTKEDNARLAAEAQQMKAADASRIQSAQAMEAQQRAAEAQKAQAAADVKARAMAAQQQAEQQARNKQRSGTGSGIAGVNGPIRDVSELRALPGNRRPVYENDDRLAGRHGDVSFLAYVNTTGQITQFKMLRSSGFRTLDANTFKAIRDWKFEPGQQGWVEIPFRWDLNGEPQEMPATLRRKISLQ